MSSQRNQKKKDGFAVIILDIIFVAIGLFILITALLGNKDILSYLKGLFPFLK
jgi:hypothetical protein